MRVKQKGSHGERELAALLTGWAGLAGVRLDLYRNLEQTRGGGHDIVGLEPYGLAVEVKRVEANAVEAWWRQAVKQAEAVQCAPLLAHRRNRQRWSFRVRVWVWPANKQLDVDMTEPVFREWFIDHLTKHPATGADNG